MPAAAENLTAGAPSTPAAPATPAAPLPEAANSGWWDSLKDADVKGWAAKKGFPDVEKALTSYRNLESLYGADRAGRTVVLPKDDNDAEGWKQLTSKLGVPETPEGYKLPLPEGADDGFSKTAASWFHQAGVPPKAANKIAEAWNGWIAEQVKAGETAEHAESDKQMTTLKGEWGAEYEAKRELAQRGYRQFAEKFGLTDTAALERAESVLGAANLTKFFAGLGSLNSESSFANPDRAPSASNATDAQREIADIDKKRMSGEINDHQWQKTYGPRKLELGKIIAAQMR